MEHFSEMDGYQFEAYMANIFRKIGFEVERTTYTNDGGIDLMATYNEPIFSGKYIVQCKNWSNDVGQSEVRDLYGVVTDARANKGILITTSDFTNQAYEFAKNKNIELINGSGLMQIVSRYSDSNAADDLGAYSFRDQRYQYLKKCIAEEPSSYKNYMEMLQHLRTHILNLDTEICTMAFFNDIIDWGGKLINRCFKKKSSVSEKKQIQLFQSEALILSGRLADATEILLSNDAFKVKNFWDGDNGPVCNTGFGKENEVNYKGTLTYRYIYAWNLFYAFKYIKYERGCNLIISKRELQQYVDDFADMDDDELLDDELVIFKMYRDGILGQSFVFPALGYAGTRSPVISTECVFPDIYRDTSCFFEKFFVEPREKYISDIENVLINHGLIK